MRPKIIIIGAGAAGCGTALSLAKAGYSVEVLEANASALAGSSDATPCRLGLGFHFMDEETALKYLHATIRFAKKYPDYKIANHTEKPYLSRGRYLLVKDSQYDKNTVIALYERLKEEYRALCKKDPSNQVFGPVEDFFKILKPNDYAGDVAPGMVELGIETAECFLDWPRFKGALLDEIGGSSNITLVTNAPVQDVKQADDKPGFIVTTADGKQKYADLVINASWENIEALNNKLGLRMPPQSRTNRTKAMIEVSLPPSLRQKNSMFFCFGPHCSFTNLGDGRGFITFEPVTNVEASSALNISELSKKLLAGNVSAEKKYYGEQIIAGVAKYIPEMSKATYINAKFGIVRTFGQVDINSKESDHHKRRESGVREQQIGWIDNGSMKLLYFLDNGEEVAKQVNEFTIKALGLIKDSTNSIVTRFTQEFPDSQSEVAGRVLSQMIQKNLQRNFSSEGICKLEKNQGLQKLQNQMLATIVLKREINSEQLKIVQLKPVIDKSKDRKNLSALSTGSYPHFHNKPPFHIQPPSDPVAPIMVSPTKG